MFIFAFISKIDWSFTGINMRLPNIVGRVPSLEEAVRNEWYRAWHEELKFLEDSRVHERPTDRGGF